MTDTITAELSVKVSWWVRHFMRAAYAWYWLTRREPDYNRLTNFAVKYGMRIQVK